MTDVYQGRVEDTGRSRLEVLLHGQDVVAELISTRGKPDALKEFHALTKSYKDLRAKVQGLADKESD